MTFRESLETLVKSRKTQKEFARDVGISPSYLNDLLSGGRGPNPDLCDLIANGDETLAKRLHKLGARAVGWRI